MSTSKRVVLELNGDLLKKGFFVTMEISVPGQLPSLKRKGFLPANRRLLNSLREWRENYRSNQESSRLGKGEVNYNSTLDSLKKLPVDLIGNISQSADDLRDIFREWFDSEDFQEISTQLREELSLNENIQVVIQTEDKDIQHLPWHLWNFVERYEKSEVAISPSTFKNFEKRNMVFSSKRKVRILAILGDSSNINISEDKKEMSSLDNASVTFLVEPKRKVIDDNLSKEDWDILFFAGHSETRNGRGRLYINKEDCLTLVDLKSALSESVRRGLQLAIFNSCDGLGLVKDLSDLQIPQMIVMREPVPDQVAQRFLKYFLRSFSRGTHLHQAVRIAREELRILEDEFPFATWLPIIFQHPNHPILTWDQMRDIEFVNEGEGDTNSTNLLSKSVIYDTSSKFHPKARQQEKRICTVCSPITLKNHGRVHYDGTSWPAQLDPAVNVDSSFYLHPGDRALVVRRDTLKFFIAPISSNYADAEDSEILSEPKQYARERIEEIKKRRKKLLSMLAVKSLVFGVLITTILSIFKPTSPASDTAAPASPPAWPATPPTLHP